MTANEDLAGWPRDDDIEPMPDPRDIAAARRVLTTRAWKEPEAEGDYVEEQQTCPTECDDDCRADCHEYHEVRARRDHQPEDCPGRDQA